MSGSEVEPIRKWSPHCNLKWKTFKITNSQQHKNQSDLKTELERTNTSL